MQTIAQTLAELPDEQLILEVETLAARERLATADLIASLIEMERRGLHRGLGFSSMFAYCTRRLHLSEDATFNRLEVARAARKIPAVLDALVDGSLTLTAARLLAPLLTEENHSRLLEMATHKSKRQIEELIATLRPAPDVPASIRRVPVSRNPSALPPSSCSSATSSPAASPDAGAMALSPFTPAGLANHSVGARPAVPTLPIGQRAIVTPLAPERFKLQFTISGDTHERLRRVQDLLGRSLPSGDVAVIFDRALTLLLDDLERKTLARTDRPRASRGGNPASRHIPAAVKREVWRRDEGGCAFVGAAGRCGETRYLEFHHVTPFADGGLTVASNLQLRCRTHNAYEAELHWPLYARERPLSWRPVVKAGPRRGTGGGRASRHGTTRRQEQGSLGHP